MAKTKTKAENNTEEKKIDKYAVIKGKAFTMVNKFAEVYPDYTNDQLNDRIVAEVIIAAQSVFGEDYYSKLKTQNIVLQIKEKFNASKCPYGRHTLRTKKQKEQPEDMCQP